MKSNQKIEKIAGVLLAAGGSSRLGYPKQLIPYKGKPLIQYMISVIEDSGIDKLFVVVGSRSKEVLAAVNKRTGIIHNPDWEAGLSTSIQYAIEAVEKEYDAVMMFIIDQPYLTSSLIKIILETMRISSAKIIATRACGQQIHPVVYRRAIFPELLRLKGDRGGKEIIRNQRVTWIDWPDPAILQDIDTPEDAEFIQRRHPSQNPNQR